MSNWLKKHQFEALFVGCLVGLYFLIRLSNLLIMPMFTDEAIYIRWSQIGASDAAWRYIPLTDGKPPLYHWLVMGVMSTNLFSDPLIEGRIVSVVAGFISAILIWWLAFELTKSKRIAYLSSLFYIFSPFMVVYDRLAIVDSLLTTISIASLLLTVIMVKRFRLDAALMLGGVVGLGLLTKSSGLFFLLFSPLVLLLRKWPKKTWLKDLFTFGGLALVVTIISQLIYNSLRLSELFFRIEQKNYEFIIPISEFFAHPFTLFWGNIKSLVAWELGYLTPPLLILVLTVVLTKKYHKQSLVLLGYVVIPMFIIASFNKIIFPRFLLFSAPFLLIMASIGLDHLLKRVTPKWQIPVVVAFMAWPAVISLLWVTMPERSPIPDADKNQYYLAQPSGQGVAEMVNFLRDQAQTQEIFLGTDGTFGLTPDAFEAYLKDEPNITIRGYYPISAVPDEVLEQANSKPTYFVYYNIQDIPPQPNLELVLEQSKVATDDFTTYLRLFKVNPI